jgi:hypothetical protein
MFWAAVFKNRSFCLLSAQNWKEKISLSNGRKYPCRRPPESFLKGKGIATKLKLVDDERVFRISDKDHHARLAIDHTVAALQMMVAAVHSNADAAIGGSKPLPMVEF